ncbi:MAG: MEKHLA domain-containing protein [Chthoniobacterales bacterium]|nr:MEKHLA domain-containing protein [Chthoniobacterales bacterium]
MSAPRPSTDLAAPTRLILANHRRLLGRDLIPGDAADPVRDLFEAPFVMLSALGPFGSDHIFNYANRTALVAFETSWDDLIGRPSSESAEPVHREERRRLLDEVGRHGFIEDYSGIRISRKGRRFRILRATVFNLLDDTGTYAGQAATFADWELL